MGPVRAISTLHDLPSIPGLDAVAVYDVDGDPFVAMSESKATKEHGLDELRKAAEKFAKIDKAEYGAALRAELGTLRLVLPASLKYKVTDALWREAACYLPVIVHGDAFDHLTDRSWMTSLAPPADRRRVLVIPLPEFHAFFDDVADAMRSSVDEVVV